MFNLISSGWLLLVITVFLAASKARAEMRPLSTDRPDATESPYTVDAGHYQLELEIGNWSKDGSDRQFSFAELNAKYGLNASNDLQLVLPFFSHVEGGAEGFGDIQVRLKHNMWGNDGGKTALALMPFVRIPTANGGLGDGKVAGGLIVPLAIEGPSDWAFGTQLEVDAAPDESGSGYHLRVLASVTASHSLTDRTAFFVELVGMADAESSGNKEGYFNTGLTC